MNDEQNSFSSDDDKVTNKNHDAIDKENYKFYRKRRYLFSKFDQKIYDSATHSELGIKLDNESWYSVTPESVGEYISERVNSALGSSKLNIIDAFAGWGGNVIQFGKRCNKVYGCEIDDTKIQYWQNNCKIYDVTNYKILNKDYLESTSADFDNSHIDAVFLSPPWGGPGYLKMEKYSFDYMTPNFNDILTKSLEFSKNLILYIPRNTDVSEICSVLSIYAKKMSEMGRENEIVFEIERLGHYSGATSVIIVYTGDLANIQQYEIVNHLADEYLNLPTGDEQTIEKCKKGTLSH